MGIKSVDIAKQEKKVVLCVHWKVSLYCDPGIDHQWFFTCLRIKNFSVFNDQRLDIWMMKILDSSREFRVLL